MLRRKLIATLLLVLCGLAFVAMPAQARFLQTDPVGYKADINWYAYVGNDPTDKTDPSGLEPDWAAQTAAENAAFQECGDWACVNSRMQDFYNREQRDTWLQGEVMLTYASIALGAEGVVALRNFLTSRTISTAFKEAFAGGRHAGMLRNMMGRSVQEIKNAAVGYEKQVAEHQAKFAEKWGSMTGQEKAGLLNKWQNDLNRNAALRDIMKGLARFLENQKK